MSSTDPSKSGTTFRDRCRAVPEVHVNLVPHLQLRLSWQPRSPRIRMAVAFERDCHVGDVTCLSDCLISAVIVRIPPQYHHPFRSKPCQRFRTKPATRSTRNPTARSNPKSATHSKTNPPRRRVDVEGLRTSGRGQFPTALFAHRLAFEFQPMRSADQAIKDRVSYRRIAAAQIVMPAINR